MHMVLYGSINTGNYQVNVLFEHDHDDVSFTFLPTSIVFKKKTRDAVVEQPLIRPTLPSLAWAGCNGAGAHVDAADAEVEGAGGAAFVGC